MDLSMLDWNTHGCVLQTDLNGNGFFPRMEFHQNGHGFFQMEFQILQMEMLSLID